MLAAVLIAPLRFPFEGAFLPHDTTLAPSESFVVRRATLVGLDYPFSSPSRQDAQDDPRQHESHGDQVEGNRHTDRVRIDERDQLVVDEPSHTVHGRRRGVPTADHFRDPRGRGQSDE